mmetsp:Transcript_92938/g.272037  ORF Transcript_92938/g.272037 Transcript_92938/m.272037 type:complete len:602 (-) Transcript_92938:75-1880(-)
MSLNSTGHVEQERPVLLPNKRIMEERPPPPPPLCLDPPPPPFSDYPYVPQARRSSIASATSCLSSESCQSLMDLSARRTAVPTPMFADAEAMKAKVRNNLIKPTFDLSSLYHTEGMWRFIALDSRFEKVTLVIIAINAVWIGVDTDYNNVDVLLNAEPLFQIVEHFFCVFFSFEWFVRFMAFRKKRFAVKDGWFMFDSTLVFTMVLETWVMTVLMLVIDFGGTGGFGDASILRMARLARLTRMARMARLLRALPELMILVKGIVAATRSVMSTICLLVILIYVYAIAFKQLTIDTEQVGQRYFAGVLPAMYNLLVYGTFMDNIGVLLDELAEESVFCCVLFITFVLMSALTVMNMLVGVLCEVVSAVAATEKEGLQVTFVTSKLQAVLAQIDKNGDGMISNDEFAKILENPEATAALQEVGVDVVGLVDFADHIFEDDYNQDENGEAVKRDLTLEQFMGVVLQLRGSNHATVKDVVDLRKFVRQSLKHTSAQLQEIREYMLRERMRRRQSLSQVARPGRLMVSGSCLGSAGASRAGSLPRTPPPEPETPPPEPCRQLAPGPPSEPLSEPAERPVPPVPQGRPVQRRNLEALSGRLRRRRSM